MKKLERFDWFLIIYCLFIAFLFYSLNSCEYRQQMFNKTEQTATK